jgi:hypothetical protein
MKNSKFLPIFETIYNRFKDGSGFLAGDVVKFKSDYKNLECYKNLGENVKQRIDEIIKSGNNIRVGRLHNKDASFGALGGTSCPACHADLYEEVAPSFWRNLVTVPLECLETANPALDLPPVPASQKDKPRAYQKPLEVTKDKDNVGPEIDEQTNVAKKQTHASKGDYELATKNTKLDNANKYDDSKPSKAEGMKKAKELKESYENIYIRMLTEDAEGAQIKTDEDVGAMGSGANAEEAYASGQFTPDETQPASTDTEHALPTPQELEAMTDEDILMTFKNAAATLKDVSVVTSKMKELYDTTKSYNPELAARIGNILKASKSGSAQ